MRDFNKTVDILVQAFLKGTLVAGICNACAVGNIIARSMSYKVGSFRDDTGRTRVLWFDQNGEVVKPQWQNAFFTCTDGSKGAKPVFMHRLELQNYIYSIIHDTPLHKEIDSTGYTLLELARMEKAFEVASIQAVHNNLSIEEGQFAGLMAVVDVLAYIHGVDMSTQEEAKKLFTRDLQLV